jgi:hypothetical protein
MGYLGTQVSPSRLWCGGGASLGHGLPYHNCSLLRVSEMADLPYLHPGASRVEGGTPYCGGLTFKFLGCKLSPLSWSAFGFGLAWNRVKRTCGGRTLTTQCQSFGF